MHPELQHPAIVPPTSQEQPATQLDDVSPQVAGELPVEGHKHEQVSAGAATPDHHYPGVDQASMAPDNAGSPVSQHSEGLRAAGRAHLSRLRRSGGRVLTALSVKRPTVEHGEQHTALPAPTIDSLVHNPVEMAVRSKNQVMVVRSTHVDRFADSSNLAGAEGSDDYLVEYSESAVLEDLYRKSLELKSLFETYGGDEYQESAELAGRMAKELRIIGTPEYEHGINEMTRSIAERLAKSSGPLYAYVMPGRSSAQIYESVFNALERQDPELASRFLPVQYNQLLTDHAREELNRSGVAIIDDWSASGEHMYTTVSGLNAAGISSDVLSVNLICASDRHLREGFYGVGVTAAYTYPDSARDDSNNDDKVTLTGLHSDNDFGFRNTFDRLYINLAYMHQGRHDMPGDYLNLSQPLLARVAREYRESNLPAHTDPAAAEAYHKRCREHAQFIQERLEQSKLALAV